MVMGGRCITDIENKGYSEDWKDTSVLSSAMKITYYSEIIL
jgi:hypothetical protein